jgi:hypothetical protein
MPTQNKSEKVTKVLSVAGLHLFLQDFSSWGNSEIVVNVAATKPIIVISSNVFLLSALFSAVFYLDLANFQETRMANRKAHVHLLMRIL